MLPGQLDLLGPRLEPETPGQALARRAAAPLAPAVEQAAPGGLFGPERDQLDLINLCAGQPRDQQPAGAACPISGARAKRSTSSIVSE